MPEQSAEEQFYSRLFTTNPNWSTPYPNMEEARRAAKIVPLLTLRSQQVS